jgi:uncharacterized protein (TIGR02996 family)
MKADNAPQRPDDAMTPDDSFLQAIIESPDDDTPRLVYADWLEDNGLPERAEFIRVQIELAHLPDGPGPSSRRLELEARERALLKEHEVEWLGRLRDWACGWCFRRGVLAALTFKVVPLLAISDKPGEDDWLQRGMATVQEMEIRDAARAFDALCRLPHLARLNALSLRANQIGDGHVRALAACPHLGSLTRLDLSKNRIGWAGIKALAESLCLPRLAVLDLSYNDIYDLDLLMLARSNGLPNLTLIDVSENPIAFPESVAGLLTSPHLTRLAVVKLSRTAYSEEEQKALQSSFGDRVHIV